MEGTKGQRTLWLAIGKTDIRRMDIFSFGGRLVDWKFRLQSIVALSRAEAKSIALSRAGQQTMHLRHLLLSS